MHAKVKIWNLAPIIDADKDQEDARRHLCTMSLHNGAVLCVKWSNGEGKYLATGSDDMIVMIWQLDRSSESWGGSSFGNTDGPNVENWRGVKRLAGHESDVTDVAWSPENTYLASAGLDSKIIIWDGRTFDRVKTLDQHQGFVKGLTWDPVGKYLASQSDDKSVRIWRVTDWEVEVVVTEPFMQSSGTTFFRRLSWSPDGGHIATANAFNGSIPVASIITRDNWKADISLVGHNAPVEVVAFNPLLFKHTDASGNLGFTSVCAVGSQDRGISVWRTHEPRPFVGVKELFEHSFLDLSWTPDGQSLFACSYDGTVAVLLFQSENLGEAVPAEERHRLLAKYGYERRGEIMAETPIQLAMEERLKESSAKSRMDELMQPESSMEGVTSTFATPSDPSVFANASIGSTSLPATSDAPTPSRPQQTNIIASEQSVTMTSDGKKRIKPLFLGNGMGVAPIIRPSVPVANATAVAQSRAMAVSSRVERGDPVMTLPDGGIPTVVVGTKRKDPPTNGMSTIGAAKKGSDGNVKGRGGAGQKEEEMTSRPAIAAPLLAVSKVRLGIPRVQSHITRNRAGLECHNSILGDQPSKVIYSQKGSVVWVDYLPSSVLLMTGNSVFSAVATEDGGLYVYSPAGRRMVPCVLLESPATLMECEGEYLMVITSCGLVSSWNVIQQATALSSVSIAPILQPTAYATDTTASSVSITSATVRQNGLPLLTTSAGQGFTYHGSMKVWVKVVDPWFSTSSFFGTDPALGSSLSSSGFGREPFGKDLVPQRRGVLALLQAAATGGRQEKDAAFAQELLNVEQAVQSVVTLTHLENQLASAQVLGSPSEYKQWLRCYVQRLADEGSVARVEELCKYLLGPVYQGGEKSEWQATVLGFQKRELLKELLPVLSSNRSLQRVVREYLSGLEMVNKTREKTSSPSGSTGSNANKQQQTTSSCPPTHPRHWIPSYNSTLEMLSTSFLQLHTAMYEWSKECPKDLKKELENFYTTKDFLDRENVFYKGVDEKSKKWVALISMSGMEQTQTMISHRFHQTFMNLHAAQDTTFSQVSAAPRMPLFSAYKKFIKDIERANKLNKAAERLMGWKRELDRATEMVFAVPDTAAAAVDGEEGEDSHSTMLLSPFESAAATSGMWFISVDIESYEFEHSKILEIGWSIWDSGVHKFTDKHYAIQEYRHLKNGKYVADRRDRFLFGKTVWASLQDSIAAFQEALETASKRNSEGLFVLIAHDMSSDEGYLRKMGVEFPRGMIKFDTVEMNGARVGDSNIKTGLGKLLDEVDIENYCLHNAGNDAHYTLDLFLWLTRNNAKQRSQLEHDAASASF
ncbi:HIR complex subunit [Mortierella sp. GBA30]|nr:HIR complex subunit [Mortierella sp. GBA30]